MKGDFHVRFRENVGVKFLCVTRLPAIIEQHPNKSAQIPKLPSSRIKYLTL